MRSRTHVVFLGPSLGLEEARSIHPAAVFLPPAAQGDVVDALRRYEPHAIGIVDGVFTQRLSVFHKEILHALSFGTWVLGSSSMGALRAAECDAFGMIGVGSVYRSIVDGVLTDDDEVALTHTHLDEDLKVLSLPMVTIRATLGALLREGTLTRPEHDAIAAAQKERHFPDRSVGSIVADAKAAGVGQDRARAIGNRFRHDPVDPKAGDARELLRRMAVLPDGRMPVGDRPETPWSHTFDAFLDRDSLFRHDGDHIGREGLVRHVAVTHPEFDELRDRALERDALIGLAHLAGLEPTEDDVAAAERTWRRQRDLTDDVAWEAYRRRSQLTDAEWREILEREALAAVLRRWIVCRRNLRRVVQPVVQELVRRDELEGSIAEATLTEHLWSAAGHYAPPTDGAGRLADLRSLGWSSGGDPDGWMRQSGFETTEELLETGRRVAFVRRLRADLEAAAEEMTGEAPGEDAVDAEAAPARS